MKISTVKTNFFFFFIAFLLINATHSQEKRIHEVEAFKEFQNYNINEITQDSYNNIWLATNKGLLRFDGENIKNIDFNIGDSSQNIQTVFTKNDSLFIGKNKSLHLKTRNQLLTFNAKSVNKIYAHKNEIFIGSNQGIFHFRENYLQPLKTTYQLDFSIINDIIFYRNHFIIATNNGLWRLNDLFETKIIKQIDKGNFTSILQIENKLFIVKNNSEILELNSDNQLIEKYNKSGIKSIKNIQNKIYVTSKNEGIDVLNATNFIFEKRINKYNSNLNSNSINAVFEDVEKNIFIATENNLFIENNNLTSSKTNFIIAGLTVNYTPVDSINISSYQHILQLKPTQNNISFLLNSVSISNPKKVEFRYKLNDIFSPWTSQTQINFANLQAGKYHFIAEARFKNSNEISRKKFSFNIDKPFYMKVWFIILSIAVLCFLLALIVDIYIKRINKKNQQKVQQLKLENHLLSLEHKALRLQMNPHFIFNVLNGIKALGNAGNTKELNKTVSQFSVLLRSVLNNSRLEEISLKDEVETLKNYLDLEQKMSSKSFQYKIETRLNNIDDEEILIPPMLVQPFVENAIKHGISTNNEGKITVYFEVKQHNLECTIIDNGIGFHQSKKINTDTSHKSVALKITKERIENLSKKGAFKIEEIKKEKHILGTKVWFKIPLKTDY